jgi:hypothetical protein
MNISAIAMALMLSCAPKIQTSANADLFKNSRENMVEFETTNSLCLDAMLVNMRAAGCSNITELVNHTQAFTSLVYFCSEHTSQSEWNINKFHAMPNGQYDFHSDDFISLVPLCSDIHLMLFIE